MRPDQTTIQGVGQRNLKSGDVALARHGLIVLTGVPGGGKSSLAFGTRYAEGQRRSVEALSAYARRFIGKMEKPKVDFTGGLSPAIAIDPKAVSRNPRATVATLTEIDDCLRVLFARLCTRHCPRCRRDVRARSAQEIAGQAAAPAPSDGFWSMPAPPPFRGYVPIPACTTSASRSTPTRTSGSTLRWLSIARSHVAQATERAMRA